MSGLDPDVLRHAILTARQNGFRIVKLSVGDGRFRAVLSEEDFSQAIELHEPSVDGADFEEPASKEVEVRAPVVGYFRQGKRPLKPGLSVEPGDALCEIIALGIANDVVAQVSGEVQSVLVEDGDPVEYGQVLATLGTP